MDRSIETIDKNNDIRIRVVGKIQAVDEKTGTFELVDGSFKLTCLPPVNQTTVPVKNESVVVSGKIAHAGNDEFELRTEHLEKISEKEYGEYHKYLKLRWELLNNGS